jgi:hypothetical protein
MKPVCGKYAHRSKGLLRSPAFFVGLFLEEQGGQTTRDVPRYLQAIACVALDAESKCVARNSIG